MSVINVSKEGRMKTFQRKSTAFIMLCVTFTALVQRLLAMVKAIRAAAAVTIPAGETTWGAVFIANGLQLIIAVLLIILGLTIVVNSLRALNMAEKNSEKAA